MRLLKPGGAIGLSPRVRGNPGGPVPAQSGPGSIPACAGEPYKPAHANSI